MKQTFIALRVVLAIVCAANLLFAYMFFARPDMIASMYGLVVVDSVHQYLGMTVGALIGVFALGALLPLVRPLKYGSMIIMLLLMHFSIFLIDIIILSRGEMEWTMLVPEMIYFLLISTLLVRYYPVREKAPKEKPEEPIENLDVLDERESDLTE